MFCVIYPFSQMITAVSLLSIKIHTAMHITQILLGREEDWCDLSSQELGGLLNPWIGDY